MLHPIDIPNVCVSLRDMPKLQHKQDVLLCEFRRALRVLNLSPDHKFGGGGGVGWGVGRSYNFISN